MIFPLTPMRILYTSDLHGNEGYYRQLLALAGDLRAGAVIIGGDLLPKEGPFATSLQDQRAFLEDFLGPLLRQARAAELDWQLYWMMGNDDWAVNLDCLQQWHDEGLAWLLPEHLYDLADGWQLTGDPYVSLTPFSIKDWERFDHPQQRVPQPAYQPCLSTPQGIRRTT